MIGGQGNPESSRADTHVADRLRTNPHGFLFINTMFRRATTSDRFVFFEFRLKSLTGAPRNRTLHRLRNGLWAALLCTPWLVVMQPRHQIRSGLLQDKNLGEGERRW